MAEEVAEEVAEEEEDSGGDTGGRNSPARRLQINTDSWEYTT